ncbi:hypothetical protein FOZ63_016252 [Perkinsus olseni]|uniref:C3H1-type domain-containing protein n=1 Tax=Perkinsus olseni TaxID=32597 RepID=A0A7J6U9Y2_PEROL|nr:hypothetical protein FOZ63_016252 [Perkinsus olseni]
MSTRHRLCQSDDGGEGRGGDSWGPFTQPMPDTIQNQLDRYRGVLRDTFIHFPVKEAEQQDPCQRPRSMPDPSVADSTTRAVHTWFFKQQPVAIESCNHHQTVVDSIPVVEAPACPPAASECPMTRESFAMSTVSTVESEKSSTKTSGNIVRGASSSTTLGHHSAGDCTPTATSIGSERSVMKGGRNGRRLRRSRQSVDISLDNPGSHRHDTHDCRPCRFVFTTLGCRYNHNCPFCHHPSHCPGEMVDSVLLCGSQAWTVSFSHGGGRRASVHHAGP